MPWVQLSQAREEAQQGWWAGGLVQFSWSAYLSSGQTSFQFRVQGPPHASGAAEVRDISSWHLGLWSREKLPVALDSGLREAQLPGFNCEELVKCVEGMCIGRASIGEGCAGADNTAATRRPASAHMCLHVSDLGLAPFHRESYWGGCRPWAELPWGEPC